MTRISLVVPSYNAADFIGAALESVVEQQHPDLELIVIDAGSTDGTAQIVERYRDQIAYMVSEADRGQSDAINKGLARATGDIVGWLNADDVLFPGALATIAANADTDWLLGRSLLIDENGTVTGTVPRSLPYDEWHPDAWLEVTCARWNGSAIGPSSFWSRRALDTVGLLDEDLHYTMDAHYWIRLLAAGFFPRLVDDPIVGYRRHGAQKSDGSRVVPWVLDLIRMQRKLRPFAQTRSQRRRLAAYQRWTITRRLPRAVAHRSLELVRR